MDQSIAASQPKAEPLMDALVDCMDGVSPADKRKLRRQLLAGKKKTPAKVASGGVRKKARKTAQAKEGQGEDESVPARVFRSRELAMKARQKKKDHLQNLQCAISQLQSKASLLENENKMLMWQFYDEVEIEDMDWDAERQMYTYPCPCGDLFQIAPIELSDGEEIARCPSCSLVIRVIYDVDEFGGRDPSQGTAIECSA